MKYIFIISLILIFYVQTQDPRYPITAFYDGDAHERGYAYFNTARCELLLMQLPKSSHVEHLKKNLFEKIERSARKHSCTSIVAKPSNHVEEALYASLQFKKNEDDMNFSLKR